MIDQVWAEMYYPSLEQALKNSVELKTGHTALMAVQRNGPLGGEYEDRDLAETIETVELFISRNQADLKFYKSMLRFPKENEGETE